MKGKATKRALVSSIVSIVLCVTMLIGTTFAWFTDTASTAVNKIQSGTLKVDIVDAADGETSLKNKELSFMRSDDEKNLTANENVLWEPGVTFKTQSFKIKNDGNLALKYKLTLNGVSGDSELLKVITFSVVGEDGQAVDLSSFEGNLTADENGKLSQALYIQGTMATSAGNEYQGKTLEGIGITVVATQYTYEYDSYEYTYDENAEYPVYASVTKTVTKNENNETTNTDPITIETTETAKETAEETTPTPVATAKVESGTKLEETATSLTLVVKEDAVPSNIKVETTEAAKTLEVDMKGLATDNEKPVIVTLFVGKDLSGFKMYHSGTLMTEDASADVVKEHNHYYYNSGTGVVTMAVKSFSPFTYVYLSSATDEEFAAATDATNKIIDISSSKLLVKFAQNVNSGIKYNGYTINLTTDIDLSGANWTPINAGGSAGIIFNGCGHTIKNGKIVASSTSEGVGFFNGNIYLSDIVFDNFTVSANGVDDGAAVVFGNVTGASGVYAVKDDLTIKNVTVKNSTVIGAKYTGAIAGHADGNINVVDCVVENTTVCGQYKAGAAVGFICCCSLKDYSIQITGNTLTNVTVKGENVWSGKSNFVLGKVVGNWCVPNGACKNNTFTGTTEATANIGQYNNVVSIDEG